jgi:hypothetical protein
MPRFGRVPGLIDESSQIYYDTLQITLATANYRFFTVPVGGAKSRLFTNMTLAGQLPAPQSLLVRAVRIIVKAATTAKADHFLNNTHVVFKVGEKEALVGPTMLFSAGAGTYNNITTDVAQNGVPDARSLWSLGKPIQIGVGQNFYLDIIYDTAPVTAYSSFYVLVVLDGALVRGVQ